MIITIEVGTSEILHLPNITPLSPGLQFYIAYHAVLVWVDVRNKDNIFAKYILLVVLEQVGIAVVPGTPEYRLQTDTNAQRTISKAVPPTGVHFLSNDVKSFNGWLWNTISRVYLESITSKIFNNFINSFFSAQMIKPCDTSKHSLTVLQENWIAFNRFSFWNS